MAGPFDPNDEFTESQLVDLAELAYTNQGVKRNLEVSPELANAIREAVTAVYGPDYQVQIFSGAQGEHGGKKSRGVTGTRRHTTGVAADVWVKDPAGRTLTENEMLPLGQHWLATKKGGVGLSSNGAGKGTHLDLIGGSGPGAVPAQKGEGLFWFYGGGTKQMRTALLASRDEGVAPKYAVAPETIRKGLVPPGGMASDPPTPRVLTASLRDDWANANAPRPAMRNTPALNAIERAVPGSGPSPIANAYNSPSSPQQVASLYEGLLPPQRPATRGLPSLVGGGAPQAVSPTIQQAMAGERNGLPVQSHNFGDVRLGLSDTGLGSLRGRSVSPAMRNPVPQGPSVMPGQGTSPADRRALVPPKPPVQGLRLPVAPQPQGRVDPSLVAPIPATMPPRIANAPAIPAQMPQLSPPAQQAPIPARMSPQLQTARAGVPKPAIGQPLPPPTDAMRMFEEAGFGSPRTLPGVGMPKFGEIAGLVGRTPGAPMPRTMSPQLAAARQPVAPMPRTMSPALAMLRGQQQQTRVAQAPRQQQNVIRAGQYTYTKGPQGYVRVQPQQQQQRTTVQQAPLRTLAETG